MKKLYLLGLLVALMTFILLFAGCEDNDRQNPGVNSTSDSGFEVINTPFTLAIVEDTNNLFGDFHKID